MCCSYAADSGLQIQNAAAVGACTVMILSALFSLDTVNHTISRLSPSEPSADVADLHCKMLTRNCYANAGTLLPGMLVNARVRRILQDGLVVSFLMYFQGSVDVFHLREVGPHKALLIYVWGYPRSWSKLKM